MSFEKIPGTGYEYALIAFDEEGRERTDDPAGRMSRLVVDLAVRERVTNIFFFCHGWQAGVASARQQYEAWIRTFAGLSGRERPQARFGALRPLYIGLHWPSLAWGDEELSQSSFGTAGTPLDGLLTAYLNRLGDRPAVRIPLETIIGAARRNMAPQHLPADVRQAYLDLNYALGLGAAGPGAPPDADRREFDPQACFEAVRQAAAFGGPNLGGTLGPLRLLSYWYMKKRARRIGEGGAHLLLKAILNATADLRTAVHLMGHSFGAIVVSGMVCGPDTVGKLPRPVDSMALVQAAVSLWSFASSIPYGAGGPGYFNSILRGHKVSGPIVTTQSTWDTAVGVFYPLASCIHGSPIFATALPEYGAIGAYGIQGVRAGVKTDSRMLPVSGSYGFETGRVYNLDGSQYIAKMEGVAGAHCDIAGPEVAHALWAAAVGAEISHLAAAH